jgi:hypothetical protein
LEIIRQNSGITDIKNASLEEIQSEIDRILSEAGKLFRASEKHREILRAYQKRTYLAYKDSPLPENNTNYSDDEVKEFLKDYDERFKKPLKANLIMYYRMRYNPDLSFDGKLLDQVGFHPCKQCHQKEVDIT